MVPHLALAGGPVARANRREWCYTSFEMADREFRLAGAPNRNRSLMVGGRLLITDHGWHLPHENGVLPTCSWHHNSTVSRSSEHVSSTRMPKRGIGRRRMQGVNTAARMTPEGNVVHACVVDRSSGHTRTERSFRVRGHFVEMHEAIKMLREDVVQFEAVIAGTTPDLGLREVGPELVKHLSAAVAALEPSGHRKV
jgi:hypothetical protein